MISKDLSDFDGCVAIITAAGVGSRMDTDTPKQYLKIDGRSILDITLKKFLDFKPVKLVVLVISPHDTYYKKLEFANDKDLIIIDGGATRCQSVNNALHFLFDSGLPDNSPVMVHDAVRPCVTQQDLEHLLNYYQPDGSACFLVSPVVDTLQQVDEQQMVTGVIDRTYLRRAYTPQLAAFKDLKIALEKAVAGNEQVTDEISALTAIGRKVKAIEGRSDNIKVTFPTDLALAAFYLKQQSAES